MSFLLFFRLPHVCGKADKAITTIGNSAMSKKINALPDDAPIKLDVQFYDENGRLLETICSDPADQKLWHLRVIPPGSRSFFRKRTRIETTIMSASRVRYLIGKKLPGPQAQESVEQRYTVSRASASA
jgi:hypothetical protein